MKKPNELRSRIMRSVKSHNTTPELFVRKLAHRLGYRFRLHRKDILGTPDLAFIRRRKVIFVHGCFWHGHDCRRGARTPKTNRLYWQGKIERNRARDASTISRLAEMGWDVLVIWECEIQNPSLVEKRILKFLTKDKSRQS